MVFREFQAIEAACFLESRRLSKAERSYCLFHERDSAAAETILRAIECVIEIGSPGQIVVGFCLPYEHAPTFSRGRFILRDVSESLKVIRFSHAGDCFQCEFTAAGYTILHSGIESWRKGSEDFGISADRSKLTRKQLGIHDRESADLWFWGPSMLP